MKPGCDFLSCLSIADVWQGLGGGPLLRNRRGIAWWRGGKHLSVSIDSAKGLWHDHAAGAGGGIVSLVEVALQCSRAQALDWLRDFSGTPRQEWTPQERREFGRRRAAAEHEAQALAEWRTGITEAVQSYRDLTMRLYHLCVRAIVSGRCTDELGAWMDRADEAEARWQRAEAALDAWRNASWDQVLVLYRQQRRAA